MNPVEGVLGTLIIAIAGWITKMELRPRPVRSLPPPPDPKIEELILIARAQSNTLADVRERLARLEGRMERI